MKASIRNVASDMGKEIASPKTDGKSHPVIREVVQDAEHPCAVSGPDVEDALAPGTTPPPYRPPPPLEAFQAQGFDPNSPRNLSSRDVSARTFTSDETSIADVPTVHVPDASSTLR